MLSDGCRNEERIIRSPTMLTRRSERMLLANIHLNGRSCSLAALKEVATTASAIFAGGDEGDDDDDDDVIHFAFLFLSEGTSNALKKCPAKGDVDVSTANAIGLPLAKLALLLTHTRLVG